MVTVCCFAEFMLIKYWIIYTRHCESFNLDQFTKIKDFDSIFSSAMLFTTINRDRWLFYRKHLRIFNYITCFILSLIGKKIVQKVCEYEISTKICTVSSLHVLSEAKYKQHIVAKINIHRRQMSAYFYCFCHKLITRRVKRVFYEWNRKF